MYISLYLLIWGEAANLRFMPECLCYVFHHMAMELNLIVEDDIDRNTGRPFLPSISGQNAFLKHVVTPIYQTIKVEVERSRNGSAPHSAWRNYDDLNEYFWSRRCFKSLKWPIDLSSNFFASTDKSERIGKTGFVEQRSFWNIFRSFDRLWVGLILFLQAMIIVAWAETAYPWLALERREVQVELLTIFITWAGIRFWQAVLDAGTQYSLVSRETKLLGFRMVLKGLVALTWTVVFAVFYGQIWIQKNSDQIWSTEANRKIVVFLKTALVFIIPELLALTLFVLPWIRILIEELDWSVIYVFTWWFHTRIFVGRGVREGLVNNIKYALFWAVVVITKICFSYFLQIRPMVGPTKALLELHIDYTWHEFFGNTNLMAVILLWAPVILIYFMDLQIWYSIFSAFVGAIIGLFSHLGEIRNIEQLRLRFQFFASAMQFNLVPDNQMLTTKATMVQKLRDAIHRLKLRYGLGQPYKKIESSQIEATRFALIWNEIMRTMREEDLISDQEFELLELPPNCWNIRVIRWPCALLCNELLLALSQASELAEFPDRFLWSRICVNEYRRCAVIEAYDSFKYLMIFMITREGTEEKSIVMKLFYEIEETIGIGKFTEVYRMKVLPQIHAKLILLIELLMSPGKDLSKIVNVLQALYELVVREFPKLKKTINVLCMEGLAPRSLETDSGFLFENAVELPDDDEDSIFYKHLRRLYTILTSRDAMHNVPSNLEARRRIAFFSNSLFMNMPRAPYVEKMMAFSVLTPYYDEEVLLGKESLRSENEDGISTLFYLQKIYEDEWRNFVQRMRRDGMKDENELWTNRARDLRLWASYRGQTLSRTVRGMMYYYR